MKSWMHGSAGLGLASIVAIGSLVSGCASDQADASLASSELYAYGDYLWRTHHVPVCWANDSAPDARAWTRDAVERSWSAAAPLVFTGWGACDNGTRAVRIFVDGSNPRAAPSGSYNSSGPTMWLNFSFTTWSPNCQATRESCIRAIAVHEFGHALGFAHEQSRADTPADCNEAGARDQLAGFRGVPIGPWDRRSVMNYCNPIWANAGILSDGDIAGVRAVYGAPGSLASDLDPRAFVAGEYAARYSDLGAAFGNDSSALGAHFARSGVGEGRSPSTLFSPQYYMAGNGDLGAAFGTTNWGAGLEHFLAYGVVEGRRASLFFDADFYLAQYADLRAAFGQDRARAFDHFRTYGVAEGRRGSREFDAAFYLSANPDLAAAFGPRNFSAGMIHYISYGQREGRRAVP